MVLGEDGEEDGVNFDAYHTRILAEIESFANNIGPYVV